MLDVLGSFKRSFSVISLARSNFQGLGSGSAVQHNIHNHTGSNGSFPRHREPGNELSTGAEIPRSQWVSQDMDILLTHSQWPGYRKPLGEGGCKAERSTGRHAALSVCFFLRLTVCLLLCPSVYQSTDLSTYIVQHVHLIVYLSVNILHLSIYLLTIYQSIYLPIYLYN